MLKSTNLLLAALMFFNAFPARANMAAPSQGGRMSGEPGGLEKIRIERETLSIDFRALGEKGSNGKIRVEAVYEIENAGAPVSLELVFALGAAEVENFAFYIDDAPVETKFSETKQLPKSWLKPEKTAWLDGRKLPYYPIVNSSSGLMKNALINAKILPGAHRLKAVYQAEPTAYYGDAPQMLNQFAYILAPARDWASFGGLDVTVNVPAGWKVVAEPALDQNGETLTMHFDNIPADAMTFTLADPLPNGYFRAKDFLFYVFLFVLFAAPAIMIFAVWRKFRQGIALHPAAGLLWSFLWAATVGITGFLSLFGADYFYPTISYGYDGIFYLLFLAVLCALVFAFGAGAWFAGVSIANQKRIRK